MWRPIRLKRKMRAARHKQSSKSELPRPWRKMLIQRAIVRPPHTVDYETCDPIRWTISNPFKLKTSSTSKTQEDLSTHCSDWTGIQPKRTQIWSSQWIPLLWWIRAYATIKRNQTPHPLMTQHWLCLTQHLYGQERHMLNSIERLVLNTVLPKMYLSAESEL